MSLFRRELKENVKNELIYNEVEINNLAILIKKIIAIDNKLYFRAMKKNSKKNIQGRARYIFNFRFYGKISSYSQKNFIKLDNLQVSTAKKEKIKDRNKKLILNCYIYKKPGHIARNYKLKNKVQQLQFNMLSIEPPLNNNNKDNIFTLEDNLKKSVGSLQQPEEADSSKEEKYLEYFEEGQQVLYWI